MGEWNHSDQGSWTYYTTIFISHTTCWGSYIIQIKGHERITPPFLSVIPHVGEVISFRSRVMNVLYHHFYQSYHMLGKLNHSVQGSWTHTRCWRSYIIQIKGRVLCASSPIAAFIHSQPLVPVSCTYIVSLVPRPAHEVFKLGCHKPY